MKEVQFAGGILLIGSCKMRSILLPLPLKLVTSCCQSQLVQCNLIFRQGGIPFYATEKNSNTSHAIGVSMTCGAHHRQWHMRGLHLSQWHIRDFALGKRGILLSIMCINFLSRIWLSCFPCVTCVFNLNFCNYVWSCTQIRLCSVTCFLKARYALMKYYSCLCILLRMNSFLS
jgi:hypothetical protein